MHAAEHPPAQAPAGRDPALVARRKSSAALLSVVSNTLLIVLKLVAGALTGSIAIVTEAIHSSIDLMASLVAYASVRKSDQPPDRQHPYGHYKLENLAAAIEGVLILIGAAIILFEATRRLIVGATLDYLGIGIAVMAVSVVANLGVSTLLSRRAKETGSAALSADAAHLHADILTSLGVLAGLALVKLTGWNQLDSILAMAVGAAIVYTGLTILARSSRVLMDERIPEPELERVRAAVRAYDSGEILSFHKLRSRGSESGARYIDLHVQFAEGTTLERAHAIAHELQDAISEAVGGADVLIHLEPASSSRGDSSPVARREGGG